MLRGSKRRDFVKEHKDILGIIVVKDISKNDREEDTNKYTTERMNSLRFIMVTKNRDTLLHIIILYYRSQCIRR